MIFAAQCLAVALHRPGAADAFSERRRDREAELMQRPDEGARYAEARSAGDFDTAAVIAGEGVDMIGEILPAPTIVERMVTEASGLLQGATNCYRVAVSGPQ